MQLAFEGTLFIIGTRFLFKNPSTVLIALPGSFSNLAHTNDVGQLERGGDALVVSVQGKRARSKHLSMTRSQMMAQILHGAEINVKVVLPMGMFALPSRRKVCITSNWHVDGFAGLDRGDPWSSSFQRPFFFSESYQGCNPIFLLDMSARHTNEAGGASSRHVP